MYSIVETVHGPWCAANVQVLGARLAWQLDAGCLWNILGSNVGWKVGHLDRITVRGLCALKPMMWSALIRSPQEQPWQHWQGHRLQNYYYSRELIARWSMHDLELILYTRKERSWCLSVRRSFMDLEMLAWHCYAQLMLQAIFRRW
jgi:hypothetical protein